VRNLVPAQARHAHVDGESLLPDLPAIEQAGPGLERERVLAGLLEQHGGEAAHAVAAGGGFRAVVVVDAHEPVGSSRARRIKRHQLVVGHAARLGGRARVVRRHRARRRAHVDQHDLVAEAVHFHEGMVGERAHHRPFTVGPYMAEWPRFASWGAQNSDRPCAVAAGGLDFGMVASRRLGTGRGLQ